MKRTSWRFIPLVCLGLLACFLWRGLSLKPSELPSSQVGKPLPKFQLSALFPDEPLFTSNAMRGKVALLNVWASWCSACMEEQPFLLQLAQQGIAIYGLNYKDQRQEAIQWLNALGNPYQMIGEDQDGKVSMDLGVYGAPETFLIDEHGIILYRYAGILTEQVWQQAFLPKIKGL